MQCVKLQTVYRSCDEEHLLFQNRIRDTQPQRNALTEYFADRHWRSDLEACVAAGMELAQKYKEPFSWLTCTNKGITNKNGNAFRHYLAVYGIIPSSI